jgi:hypothetical protein
MHITDKVIAWILVLAVAAFVFIQASRACGDELASVTEVAAGIVKLQPATDLERAAELGLVFHRAAKRHDLDPRLLVAISFRESSLSRAVESGRIRGRLGEVGLMQCHGVAIRRHKPSDCDWGLTGARCQVETGAAYLAAARRQCGGSWWRWVAAYGLGACPSEQQARGMASAKNAHRYYKKIGGQQWR